MMHPPFHVRRKFFDSYGNRDEEHEAGLPRKGIRFACPCCGYPTLNDRAFDEICWLCGWEDDAAEPEDEEPSVVNHGFTLAEARDNFEEFLVMYAPEQDTRMGGADSETTKELKRRIISAFDEMTTFPSAPQLRELWTEVHRCERQMYREFKVKMRPYINGFLKK